MRYFLLLSLLALLAACEPVPRIRLKEGNPPAFIVGGIPLAFLEIRSEQGLESHNQTPLWEVRNNFTMGTKNPSEVVYGVLPEGFRQITPDAGEKPSQLVVGTKYRYVAMGSHHRAKIGCFEMSESGAVEIECR